LFFANLFGEAVVSGRDEGLWERFPMQHQFLSEAAETRENWKMERMSVFWDRLPFIGFPLSASFGSLLLAPFRW
jgi:hypothetical protein